MAFTFISGATGGIGKAFSLECARRGYDLFLTGRSNEKLASLKEEILKINAGLTVHVFACDLTDKSSRGEMLNYIDQNGVKFDRILNVAGVDTQKAFLDYTEDKVLFQLKVNAEATTHLTYALLNRRTEACELLAVSSMSGVTPMPYFALYSATKSMITSLYSSLHYELKKQGVKVTVVLPGGVPTREDVIKEIEKQGLWGKLSVVTPEKLAKKSLKALSKNKMKYVPGGFNKLLNFFMKLVPLKIQLKFIANRWKKTSKDAF